MNINDHDCSHKQSSSQVRSPHTVEEVGEEDDDDDSDDSVEAEENIVQRISSIRVTSPQPPHKPPREYM